MKKIIFLVLLAVTFVVNGQVNIAAGGTVTTCSDVFVDSGGAGGNYGSNESQQITICPDTPGNYIQLNFTSLAIEGDTDDFLILYNGNDDSGLLLGTLTADASCDNSQFISSTSDGCITIYFESDFGNDQAGWTADISCVTIAGGASSIPNNSVCAGANAFCADAGALEFPNISDTDCVPNAPQVVVDQSCLSSAPNPAWYFVEIAEAGEIIIDISQTTGPNGTGTGLDVDYVLWGPFPDVPSACADFTAGDCLADHFCSGTAVDCSYDSAPTEVATIPNAQIGEFYMFLITNFDGASGFITLSQNNIGASGAGATDCCPISVGVNPTSCGASDGVIRISLLTPNTTYIVTYNDPTLQSVSATSDALGVIEITGLPPGTYTNIDVNAPGCSTDTVTLSGTAGATFTSLSDNGPICSGDDAVFSIVGTPNATITYTINGGGNQSVVINASGNATVTIPGATVNQTITISSIEISGCTTNLNETTTVSISGAPILTLTASNNPTTCGGTDGSIILATTNLPDGTYTVNYEDAVPSAQTTTMTVVGNVGTISGLPEGTYNNITVVNGSCVSVDDIDVVLVADLIPILTFTSSVNPTTCGGNDGSIVLATTNLPDGTYTISYEDAVPSIQTETMVVIGNVGTISGLYTGTYNNIIVTNAGCTSVDDVDVVLTEPLIPVLAVSSTIDPSPCGSTNGSIILTTTNLPDGSYTVSYTDATPSTQTATMIVSGNIGTISGLSEGVFNDITVTYLGCTSLDGIDVILVNDLAPTLAISAINNPTTCLGNDGSIILASTNLPDGTYTVNYEDAVPSPQTAIMVVVGNVGTISGLSVGVYNNITVTSAGCTSVDDIDVTLADVLTPLLAINALVNPSTCNGTDGSIVLDITNLPDGTYTVNYEDAVPSAQTLTIVVVGNVGTISGLPEGTYNNISITNAGCTSVENIDVLLVDPPLPTFTSLMNNTPLCAGDDAIFNIVGTPNATITYTINGGGNQTVVVDSNGDATITILGATVNQVISISSIEINSCVTNLNEIATIIVATVPGLSLTASNNPTTCGGTDGSIVLATTNLPDGTYTVNYEDAVPSAQTITMVVVGNVGTISGLTEGTYNNISITNAGCTSIDDIDVVLVGPLTPVLAVSSTIDPSPCGSTNGSIILTTTNLPDGSYTISYIDAAPSTQTATMIVSGNVGTISGLSEGVFNDITVTYLGCTSLGGIDVLLVNDLAPTLVIVAINDPTICNGTDGSIILSSTNLPDGTYTVNYEDAVPSPQTTTMVVVANVGTISGLSVGVYNNINVTNAGCTSVDDIDVTLADVFTPELTINTVVNPSTCNGVDGSIVLDVTNLPDGTYTVNYEDAVPSPQTTIIVVVGNVGTISGLPSGVYDNISITNVGCTSVEDIDVLLVDPPLPVFTSLMSNSPVCLGTDVIFSLTGSADATITYTLDEGVTLETVALDTLGNGVVIISGATTNQTIELTEIAYLATACSVSLPDVATVVINAIPVIDSLTGNGPICSGEDAVFTLSGTPNATVTYTLDNGITTQDVTLDASGNAQVIIVGPTTSQTILLISAIIVADQCNANLSATVDVNANPNPTPNAATDIEECDVDASGNPDTDGVAMFDLSVNTGPISSGLNNVTITYYTGIDSNGFPINQILTPEVYINDPNLVVPVGGAQTIYVLIQNNDTACYAVTTFEIQVTTVPFIPAEDLFTCDDDNDSFAFFNLENVPNQIFGGDPTLQVTLHETLAQATLGVGAIPINVPYQNIDTDGDGIGSTQNIYVRIVDATTNCVHYGVFFTLNVLDSPVVAEGELTFTLCEDDASTDGSAFFDLITYSNTVLLAGTDPSTVTVNFYTALDASGNPDSTAIITNPAAFQNTITPNQVIYVSVVSTINFDSNGDGCEIIKEITLHVDVLPTAEYTEVHVCDADDTADGFFTFDLSTYISEITGGDTSVAVTFYWSQAEAEAGSNTGLIDATIPFTNTVNPQPIFARVYNPTTECFAVALVVLHVDPLPTPLSSQAIMNQLGNNGVMEACDGNIDGSGALAEQVAEFDLTQWETLILTGDGPSIESGVSANYYTDYDEAVAQENAIASPTAYTNTSNPQTIYVRVTNDGTGVVPATDGSGCYVIVEFQIFVPIPQVEISGTDILCVDENGVPLVTVPLPILSANATPVGPYDYQWALNGVDIPGAINQNITVTQPGEFTVTVSGPSDFNCINTASTTIVLSGIPDGFNATVTTNAFADSQQIVAVATSNIPNIEFLYALDDGELGTSGIFNNVSPGLHTVTITDGEGCWEEILTIMVIDYPRFFTPNGDGVNDTWQIIGIESIPISQIYIFDRFGKLLKQLDPDGVGWNGTYNGNQMPASDYWFKIIYIEGINSPTKKEFRAHFSLKR